MIIFPAIDILDGNAVRLKNGKYDMAKIYGDPLDMSARWYDEGAEHLHIVDLNGARGDKDANCKTIEKIALKGRLNIQVGGGIRTMSDIKRYFSCGISRVVLGSACIDNPELVKEAVSEYGGDKIVCGIDSRNGKVSVGGWLKDSERKTLEVCLDMQASGVRTVVYTDISRDGVLTGPDLGGIDDLTFHTELNIIASGGIKSTDDISSLKSRGVYGAILGTALYENKLSLKEALIAAKE